MDNTFCLEQDLNGNLIIEHFRRLLNVSLKD